MCVAGVLATIYRAWCGEIGSLMSLDAPEFMLPVTLGNQFHFTSLYMYMLRVTSVALHEKEKHIICQVLVIHTVMGPR